MSSKAAILAENAKVWDELQEWKHGNNTMELEHVRLRDARQFIRTEPFIKNDVSEEERELEVKTSRLTASDIRHDTKIMQRQLSEWKAGVRTYARSRSPRRDAIRADSTSSRRAEALGYVAAHTFIRSEAETRLKAIITERDATIAKQAKLIADLQAGKGLIGPVLKEAFPPSSMDDNFWQDRMERPEMKLSVVAYIKENGTMARNLSSRIMFNTQY